MKHEVELGKLIESLQQRDAVHVAVAPVMAAEELYPGQHIGFVEGTNEQVRGVARLIGVVDPFLENNVLPGQRFWMFLYPNTITGLRHDWSHPAFNSEASNPTGDLNFDAACIVARMCGKTYEALMDDAYRCVGNGTNKYGDYIMDNSERYKGVGYDLWKQFWKHYEQVHDVKLEEEYDAPYTCSC
jgi:hypothetical protein